MLGYRDLFPRREQQLLRLTDRFSDRIVVNSRAVLKHMIEDEGIAPGKLFLSHNGYIPETFYPLSEATNQPEVLRDYDVVIGVIAALRPEKNIGLLLKAVALLENRRFGVVILGSGPEQEKLKTLCRELNLQDKVHFEPGRPDVAEWYRALDIFVLTSVSESFPNALLEAMASGCAVVASRVGGIPELVEDGVTGLVFESNQTVQLAEQLGILMDCKEKRQQLGAQAAKTARSRFSMDVYCRRMENFYLELIEKRQLS